MKRCLAVVLGGGGARGALQVGALRALMEAGVQPDLLVGTSAGALNATLLAVRGFIPESVNQLEVAWHAAAAAKLLPAIDVWVALHALLRRRQLVPHQRLREFYIAHGLPEDLHFSDLRGPRLILVSADMSRSCCVLYGEDPEQFVIEGLLASTALPPWFRPLEIEGRLLMDGGLVSNLPIEPALRHGATDIIALSIADPASNGMARGMPGILAKIKETVERRETDLEFAMAAARGVPVRHIVLRPHRPIPVWDFGHTAELITRGHAIARGHIAEWPKPRPRRGWRELLSRFGNGRSLDGAPRRTGERWR